MNYFSTHLVTTENHKLAVMLRVSVGSLYKWLEGHFVKFANRRSFIFSDSTFPQFFLLAFFQTASQLILTAAWLAQLVECQCAVHKVKGLSPRPDQHSGS